MIHPCALCHLPAVVHTVAGAGEWDSTHNELRASYVMPVFPDNCPMLAAGEGTCNSGTKATPEEAIGAWNLEQTKKRQEYELIAD